MPDLVKYYDAGTVSIVQGTTTLTGHGTAWQNIIRTSDRFTKNGRSIRISADPTNTSATLAEPWPDADLDHDTYEIAITYDGPEFQLRTRELLEEFAGAVQSLVGGDGITIDDTDPNNPVIAFSGTIAGPLGVGSVPVAGTSLTLDRSGSNYVRFNEGGTLRGLMGISSGGGNLITGDNDNDFVVRGESILKFAVGGTQALAIPGAGQLRFPATANPSSGANDFDDYEEGTWTPVDASGVGVGITVTSAKYVKFGKWVIAKFRVIYAGNANGTTASLGGLPFTSATDTNFGAGSAYSTAASPNGLFELISVSNSTRLEFINSAVGQPTNATLSGATVSGTIIYEAAA